MEAVAYIFIFTCIIGTFSSRSHFVNRLESPKISLVGARLIEVDGGATLLRKKNSQF
jgi:hypothetical protein